MDTIEQNQYSAVCNDRFASMERRMAKVEAEAAENKAWRLRLQFAAALVLSLSAFVAAVITIIHNLRDIY